MFYWISILNFVVYFRLFSPSISFIFFSNFTVSNLKY